MPRKLEVKRFCARNSVLRNWVISREPKEIFQVLSRRAIVIGTPRSGAKISVRMRAGRLRPCHSWCISRSTCFIRSFDEDGKVSGQQSSTCSGSEEAIFRNARSCFP